MTLSFRACPSRTGGRPRQRDGVGGHARGRRRGDSRPPRQQRAADDAQHGERPIKQAPRAAAWPADQRCLRTRYSDPAAGRKCWRWTPQSIPHVTWYCRCSPSVRGVAGQRSALQRAFQFLREPPTDARGPTAVAPRRSDCDRALRGARDELCVLRQRPGWERLRRGAVGRRSGPRSRSSQRATSIRRRFDVDRDLVTVVQRAIGPPRTASGRHMRRP